MSDGNGTAPPESVLAGHLVLYPDAVAFRPDGGGDETVIIRPLIPMARDQLVELLSPGDGGMLAAVMNGQIPKMNREQRREMAAKMKGAVNG
jgi:hypothetical protein